MRNLVSIGIRKVRGAVRRLRRVTAPPAAPSSFDAATIDLASPQVARDPFRYYESLRDAGSVQFLARHGFWIVLDYADVEAAFAQPAVFSNAPYADIDAVLLAADPPQHTAIRRVVAHHFSAATLQRLSAVASERAAMLVRPRLDVVSEYGAPLSRAVAAELAGFDGAAVEAILAAERASAGAGDHVATLIRSLDVIAERSTFYDMLCRAGVASIDDAAARSLVRLLWLAATVTTERVITRSVLRLLQHEDLRSRMEVDHALVAPFVEEVLRLHPPEHMVPRLTTRPVVLGGVALPAHAPVQLCVSAANRDPLRFPDPLELRLNRPDNRHLTFGSGVHRCVGAALARGVVVTAVTTLLQQLPRFRALQPLDAVRFFQTATALSPEELVIGE